MNRRLLVWSGALLLARGLAGAWASFPLGTTSAALLDKASPDTVNSFYSSRLIAEVVIAEHDAPRLTLVVTGGPPMRGSKDDLPVVFEGNGVVNQSTEWGTMTVSRLVCPPMDGTPLYKGLPEDRCQCPHWGYLVRGRMRIKYADRDEVYTAGDLFYMEPGHVPVIEEDVEVVEFSPTTQFQQTVDVVSRNMAAMQQPG